MNQVAQTILNQLGGNRFLAMTGAKNIIRGSNYIYFTINGRTQDGKRINKVKITLAGDDTYTIETINIRGTNMKTISEVSGIYAEQLAATFERLTQLRTSLGRAA